MVETLYEDLLAGKRLKRVILRTLPEYPNSGFGLAILKLASKPKADVLRGANLLVKRLKRENKPNAVHGKLMELIEFVAISRLSDLSKRRFEPCWN